MPDFQLVPAAVMLPGTCATCGRSGDAAMIDTLAEFPPPGGRIYLCPTCVGEASRLWGYPTPEAYAEAQTLLAQLEAETAVLRARVAELEAAQVQVVPMKDVLKSLNARPKSRRRKQPVS